MKIKFGWIKIVTVAVVLSFVGAASASAWGPERDTYTMANPADAPVFNSITDNPTIGDERDFVRVGEINADVTEMGNSVEVVPGKEYLVYIYFHNNASSTYNYSAYNYSGIALGTKLSTAFSKVITPESKGTISATITADNATPKSVWDEAYMTTSTGKVTLEYVPGSAKIYNDNFATNEKVVSSNMFTEEGTLIGLTDFDGAIPGCEEYHGVITYVLLAKELNGDVTKMVSLDGENYSESVDAKPGDKVYFKVTIRNAGDIALTNATIKDALPEGLSLVPGSVKLYGNDSTTPDELSDNMSGDGYNLGKIGTGNVVTIVYQVTVADDLGCPEKALQNEVTLVYDSEETEGDSDKDSATVVVKKDGCKRTCATDPDMEGCQEIVNTGPLEIVMAILIVLGIGGGCYYLYRTRKTLKKVETVVTGKDVNNEDGGSQNPDNMVK